MNSFYQFLGLSVPRSCSRREDLLQDMLTVPPAPPAPPEESFRMKCPALSGWSGIRRDESMSFVIMPF